MAKKKANTEPEVSEDVVPETLIDDQPTPAPPVEWNFSESPVFQGKYKGAENGDILFENETGRFYLPKYASILAACGMVEIDTELRLEYKGIDPGDSGRHMFKIDML